MIDPVDRMCISITHELYEYQYQHCNQRFKDSHGLTKILCVRIVILTSF